MHVARLAGEGEQLEDREGGEAAAEGSDPGEVVLPDRVEDADPSGTFKFPGNL